MSDVIITADNLVKEYTQRRRRPGQPRTSIRAVDDVSLTVRRGETLGIVGESGSGKSTLARMLLGLITPTSGTVAFLGEPLSARSLPRVRSRAQMVFQDPYSSLDPRRRVHVSVEEPLRVHTRLPAAQRRTVAEEAFRSAGLSVDLLDRFPHELSGGQRQRVSIARAIVVQPELLVCDEPVSALDVSVQAQVLNVFTDLKLRTGVSSVFISHDLAVVRHVSDRIAVMRNGRIVEQGLADDVFTDPQHPYTRTLLDAIPGRRERVRIPLSTAA